MIRHQTNRPAAPLPPSRHNNHSPTAQESQEYSVLLEDPPEPSREASRPSNQTDQSSDTYAVPYQHMISGLMRLLTMMLHRNRTDSRSTRPVPMTPDIIPSAASSDGYLEPVSNRNCNSCVCTHASQLSQNSALDPDYQELNEISSLAMRVTTC